MKALATIKRFDETYGVDGKSKKCKNIIGNFYAFLSGVF
jgi:hypothetical protein